MRVKKKCFRRSPKMCWFSDLLSLTFFGGIIFFFSPRNWCVSTGHIFQQPFQFVAVSRLTEERRLKKANTYGLTLHHQLHIGGAGPAYAVVCRAAVDACVSASHAMDGQHRRFVLLSVLSHLHLRLALRRADWGRRRRREGVEINIRWQPSLTSPSLLSLQKGKQSNAVLLLDSEVVNFRVCSRKLSQKHPHPKVGFPTWEVGDLHFVRVRWQEWLSHMSAVCQQYLLYLGYIGIILDTG